GPGDVGLQPMRVPNPPNRLLTDADRSRHRASAPVSSARRSLLSRTAHDLGCLRFSHRGGAAAPMSILGKAIDALGKESSAPTSGRVLAAAKFVGDVAVGMSVRTTHHDANPLNDSLRGLSRPQ